jgi:GTP-binding protein
MKAKFLLSTLSDFPQLKSPQGKFLPEVALAGRSNVGKSSLLNHLFGNNKLARTSATPGKTQLINFFLIDDSFLLVDLPGYGFAKAPLEEQKKWSEAIDRYLNSRSTLKLLLLLIDSRRGLLDGDKKLLSWAEAHQIQVLLILTKSDKLSASEKLAVAKQYPHALLYSTKDQHARRLLEKQIENVLWD